MHCSKFGYTNMGKCAKLRGNMAVSKWGQKYSIRDFHKPSWTVVSAKLLSGVQIL